MPPPAALDGGGAAGGRSKAPGVEHETAIGHATQPLDPVLGDQDADAGRGQLDEGVDERRGRLVVELGRGFVEQHDRRSHREDAGERGPLALAAREVPEGAIRQVRGARRREGEGHVGGDALRRPSEAFRPEGRVTGDGSHDALGLGVLEGERGSRGDRARLRRPGVEVAHDAPAAEAATVEVGDGPRQDAQERRLAGPRAALQEHQLTSHELHIDVRERVGAGAGVPEPDPLEAGDDHRARTSAAAAASAAPASAATTTPDTVRTSSSRG